MKKFFYFVAAFISLAFVSSCCCNSKTEHPLVGMWQYCQPIATAEDGAEVQYTHRPIYKVIAADGSYFVSVGRMTPVENTALQEVKTYLTQTGRYEIESDSVYYEYINLHNHAPYQNTTSVIKYKFADENNEYLYITFENNESGVGVDEVWRRVEFLGTVE